MPANAWPGVGGEVKPVKICGVDPGMNITGYAVIDFEAGRVQVHDAGVIRPDAGQEFADRLAELRTGIVEVLREHRPGHVAVEALYAHYRHPRTAIVMGHARGVILEAAAAEGVGVQDLSATQIKRHVCAHGLANKRQVQRAMVGLVGPAVLDAPQDVADALAVAVCAGQILSHPQRVR